MYSGEDIFFKEGGEFFFVKYFIVKFVIVVGILDIIVYGYKVDIVWRC